MPTNLAVATSLACFDPKRVEGSLQLFSTCPSSLMAPDDYVDRVGEVARWSEAAGCTGILVYTDNSLVDPWLVSQVIAQRTRSLCPLVAVQPVYMHPYSVAKMVATIAFLHHRRVFLNMVAGGFKNDLLALNDSTPHDNRYERLIEYTRIIQNLLEGHSPFTFEGKFYRVTSLTLNPSLPPDLYPGFLMSGSSAAGLAAAKETGAIAVEYPRPPRAARPGSQPPTGACGVRIGIITRPREGEAWKIARARFPEDRKGQLTRQLAAKVSDSSWHQRLSDVGKASRGAIGTYWMHPFENYQTNCPYLVGSYQDVADDLALYLELGCRTFILDIPAAEEEFEHMGTVFQSVSRKVPL